MKPNFFCFLCLTALAFAEANADDAFKPQHIQLQAPVLQPLKGSETTEAKASNTNENKLMEVKPTIKPVIRKSAFSAFTGKIKGNHVRLRLQPDLEGRIVKELTKNDFVAVVDEEGDFWAIEAPEGIKAYVFRSFILDNVVEGNRVNVRLEPNLDAPIIGHLNSGDKIKGTVSALNNKWFEIPPPAGAKFFVAKDFIERIGGPELKAQMDKRKVAVEQLLDAASLLSKAELLKPFEEIDFERIKRSFHTIIQDYTDFPHYSEQAKEALAQIQDNYLEKRIAYLETKAASLTHQDDEAGTDGTKVAKDEQNDKMKMWEPIEEALFLTWAHLNEEKSLDDYYDEQRIVAVTKTGILEAYQSPVMHKPGDFILKDKDLPVAYVYSTKVDLQNYVGKKITIIGSPRPNNNFAFEAFYVHGVE